MEDVVVRVKDGQCIPARVRTAWAAGAARSQGGGTEDGHPGGDRSADWTTGVAVSGHRLFPFTCRMGVAVRGWRMARDLPGCAARAVPSASRGGCPGPHPSRIPLAAANTFIFTGSDWAFMVAPGARA